MSAMDVTDSNAQQLIQSFQADVGDTVTQAETSRGVVSTGDDVPPSKSDDPNRSSLEPNFFCEIFRCQKTCSSMADLKKHGAESHLIDDLKSSPPWPDHLNSGTTPGTDVREGEPQKSIKTNTGGPGAKKLEINRNRRERFCEGANWWKLTALACGILAAVGPVGGLYLTSHPDSFGFCPCLVSDSSALPFRADQTTSHRYTQHGSSHGSPEIGEASSSSSSWHHFLRAVVRALSSVVAERWLCGIIILAAFLFGVWQCGRCVLRTVARTRSANQEQWRARGQRARQARRQVAAAGHNNQNRTGTASDEDRDAVVSATE